MHFIIDRSALSSVLQKTIPATSANGEVPAFSCIRIEASHGLLTLFGTDNKVAIKVVEACEVVEPGAVGVNGKALQDIVSKLQSSIVTIKMNGNRVQIKCGRAAVHLNAIAEDSFIPAYDYSKLEFAPADGFFKIVDKVRFATGDADGSRPFLLGVRMVENHMAATDGHRLAMAAHSFKIDQPITVQADLLARVTKPLGEKPSIAVADNRLHFKSGPVYASVALLEGAYPNYLGIIPSSPFKEAKLKYTELKAALELVKVAADPKQLTVTLEFSEDKLMIFSKSESADASEEVSCAMDGKETASFNIEYLLAVLDRLSDKENVVCEVRGPMVPLVVKEEGYVNLIMPKRTV